MRRDANDAAHPPWQPPPESLTLGRDQVHVWRAALDRRAAERERVWPALSDDERARAERFYFPQDRERFVVARGLLRAILSRYLGQSPEQIRFAYSPSGKPSLMGVQAFRRSGVQDQQRTSTNTTRTPEHLNTRTPEHLNATLRFNLSHSHGLALYAITCEREIGIDLEFIRAEPVAEPIAERFFSAPEVAALRALPTADQTEAFFHCWTRKEAYIKARGEGLSLPLDAFEVSLAPGEPAALLSVTGDPAEVSRWALRDLAPGPGYVAALAVEGHGWQLRCWDWPAGKE